MPSPADGVPREKRPVAIKKIEKKKTVRTKPVAEETVLVEEKPPPPVILAPPPTPAPPPVCVWMPGHWTWNSPMNMHVWVPGMHIRPPSVEEERSLALWRLGKWIGIGRED